MSPPRTKSPISLLIKYRECCRIAHTIDTRHGESVAQSLIFVIRPDHMGLDYVAQHIMSMSGVRVKVELISPVSRQSHRFDGEAIS